MKLNKLTSVKSRQKKRLGRGQSSGKGKTAGRGAKGQKKRGKIKLGFEGGQLPLYKRLPQRKGIGNVPKAKGITITTNQLNFFPAKSTIDEKKLREKGLIPISTRGAKIKIVVNGKLAKPLKIALPTTKKALSIIKKAGGSIIDESSA